MKKKVSYILAAVLIAAGILISLGVLFAIDGDFTRLSSAIFVEKTFPVEGDFHKIHLYTQSGNVELVPSETDECYVVCNMYEYMEPTVTVEADSLVFTLLDNLDWNDRIGIYFDMAKITVYLPKTEFESLSIGTYNGNVSVPAAFRFGEAEVLSIRGDVDFRAAVQKDFSSETVYGNISLSDVLAEKISSKTEEGDIFLTDCDADSLKLETVNGNITGSLLSDKVFTTETKTGTVNVPDSKTGGSCEITTVGGDVGITIKAGKARS